MSDAVFQRRSGIILLLLAGWAILAAAHVVYYTCWKREKLLEQSLHLAWREGTIPAARGSILDKNGVPLVWTELTHDLALPRNRRSARTEMLIRHLTTVLFPLHFETDAERVVLKRNLTPEEILRLRRFTILYPELEIRPHMERKTLNIPEIHEKWTEWEEKYNSELAGTAGLFRVMLDSTGAWVPGTTEILAAPIPGRNVTVPYELKGERR